MKTVFATSSEVIHLWANQRQDEARMRNVFFYGKKIYSYGYHYLLAEFIYNDKGEEAVYINNSGYSNTTAKHISEVQSATRHYKQFYESYINPYKVLQSLEYNMEKLIKAKKPHLYIDAANQLYNSFMEYITWKGENFEASEKIPMIKAAIDAINQNKQADYYIQKKEIIERENAARIERQKKINEEQIKKFYEYETPVVYGLERDLLRISKDEQFVETTQRVRIPLKEAYFFYQLIKAGKNIHGLELKADYSSYTVIGWEKDVLHIGCHHIEKQHVMEVGEKVIELYKKFGFEPQLFDSKIE